MSIPLPTKPRQCWCWDTLMAVLSEGPIGVRTLAVYLYGESDDRAATATSKVLGPLVRDGRVLRIGWGVYALPGTPLPWLASARLAQAATVDDLARLLARGGRYTALRLQHIVGRPLATIHRWLLQLRRRGPDDAGRVLRIATATPADRPTRRSRGGRLHRVAVPCYWLAPPPAPVGRPRKQPASAQPVPA